MNIRDYKKDDVSSIVNLYNTTVVSKNWDQFNEKQKKVILLPKDNLDFSHKLMSENITIVLEEDSIIKGFCMMDSKGYIRFLYIERNNLMSGYGSQLLFAILNKARILGFKKAFLHASKFAENFYEKIGFVNCGQESYKIAGVDFEGSRFEKEL